METIEVGSAEALFTTPYSLGKLIEWKRSIFESRYLKTYRAPYSLGKLIEWKLCWICAIAIKRLCHDLPTR
jgi:hypothetical protein